MPRLREAFAADLGESYQGKVETGHVVISAGCNQAFCLVTLALANPGDEIVLTLPYYFNHDMWLRMNGIGPIYLEPGPDGLPAIDGLGEVVSDKTTAVVVVTPGNPTGATVPASRISELAVFCRTAGAALILDETYRSFAAGDGPPHRLFADDDWADVLVSLHSFSKELAIPGHRVGAIVAAAALNREVAKLLDCVAVCAPRLGQEAALAGLAETEWRAARVRDTTAKRRVFEDVMSRRPGGFALESAGGMFGWVRHPHGGRATSEVVRELVVEHDVLTVPGTAFLPQDRGMLRLSFANLDEDQFVDLAHRLDAAGAE